MSEVKVCYDGVIILRREALEKKLKRYFTGNACKHGHIAERSVADSTCSVCAKINRKNTKLKILAGEKFSPPDGLQEGTVHKMIKHGSLTVKEYYNNRKILIVFLDTGYETITDSVTISKGVVIDRLRNVSKHGKINDLPKGATSYFDEHGSERTYKFYSKWVGMFVRCYDEVYHTTKPSYKGVTVCDEWFYLSNFKRWFEANYPCHGEDWHLDKDLTIMGSRVYSPDTCCFVPQDINCLLNINPRSRGELPLGVVRKDGKYCAQMCENSITKHLGLFSTEEEAFTCYKNNKEQYIKMIAKQQLDKGNINIIVFNNICNKVFTEEM